MEKSQPTIWNEPRCYVVTEFPARCWYCWYKGYYFNYCFMVRDSSVGIMTRYVLDGPGIESWRVQVFLFHPERPWAPYSLLYNGQRVSFPGIKHPWRGVEHSPPYSVEFKERVDLRPYSPSGWTLPLQTASGFYKYKWEFLRYDWWKEMRKLDFHGSYRPYW